jgi:hypothetical protein
MSRTSRSSGRSRKAYGLAAAAAVSGLLIAVPAATSSATAATAGPATNCPAAFPTTDAVDGVKGTGYTVEKGTKADPFTATVLGRITDGIAPGIDMIMADLDSPALERAGGVWAGMSGSPVYTADGKLIGSVSYGLASPSSIAGITPAADMLALRNDPSNARRAGSTEANEKVAVTSAKADRLVRTGSVTKSVASQGFVRLSTPVTAVGIAKKNTGKFLKDVTEDSGTAVRTAAAGKSSTATSSPSEIFAGSNYAAAFSYGDVALYALGTTTYVCDDTAVAFGHPFYSNGPADYSVHPAEAVYVQPDPTYGPFKVGNPGGPVGTVTWDGTVGLRSTLGRSPEHQFPVTTSLVNDQGKTVTGKTVGVYQPYAADIAALHVQGAVVKALGAQSPGSAKVKITVTGTRANGKKFTITHQDHFADTYDISYLAGDSVFSLLYPLAGQPFEDVDITKVTVTGTVSTTIRQYRVTKVETKESGKWVALKNETTAAPGAAIPLRATLKGYRNSDSLTVPLTVSVPESVPSGSTGLLTIADGLSAGYDEDQPEPGSLTDLINRLKDAPSSDTLVSKAEIDTEDGPVASTRTADVDAAISAYYQQIPISVQ